MSEYQYYEFRAVDRPLSAAVRDELRRLSSSERRTAGHLRAAAEALAEARRRRQEEKAARERLRHEKELAEARRARLDALARRGDRTAWAEVDGLIARRNNKAYDEATALLTDLRDLALERCSDDSFHARLRDLRRIHGSKPRLLERLTAAGLT
jgi:hypothetical protein